MPPLQDDYQAWCRGGIYPARVGGKSEIQLRARRYAVTSPKFLAWADRWELRIEN